MKIIYKNICSVSTMYSLLLYLLHSDKEDIEKTFFFFHHTIPEDISKCFEGQYFRLPSPGSKGWVKSVKMRLLFWYKYIKWFKLPSFRHKKLFIQDHLEHSAIMIGHKYYTLLEDAPGAFNFYDNGFFGKNDREFIERPAYKFKRIWCGPVIYKSFGHNLQCTDVILSAHYDLDYLKHKTLHYVNIKQKWSEASEAKRQLICKLLSIDSGVCREYQKRSIVLFTQPLYKDGVSMSIHEEIYKKLIAKYPQDQLLLKIHPRDDQFPYESLFPNVAVIRNPLPSQLLELIGIKFDKAVTLFSTAVFDLGYHLPIDWYGTECHPAVLNKSGHVNPPASATICDL